jgi:ferritin-like metal-binding protein YciE
MHPSKLTLLFTIELQNTYWIEKALVKILPKMLNNSLSRELRVSLEENLSKLDAQNIRIEKIFELIHKKPTSKKSEIMESMFKELDKIMDVCDEGSMCDVGMISMCQKIDHYLIASYGTLLMYAETLQINNAVDLLKETIQDRKESEERMFISFLSIDLEEEHEIVELDRIKSY